MTADDNSCNGSGRIPTDITYVGHIKWGRCPSCKQTRPLAMGGWLKFHQTPPALRRPTA